MSARNAVAKVKRALKAGDAAQWEAAEGIAELADDYGWTQQEIAEEVGCNRSTVSRHLQVWRAASDIRPRPSFSDEMAKVRTDNANRTLVPSVPEARAKFVAELLKDKKVADAPVVQKVQEKHADRRHRERERAWNREQKIPTRTEESRERRLHSNVENQFYWRTMLVKVEDAIRAMNDASNELDRTGLPRAGSGEIIRKVRTLARAADRFTEAASTTGIGSAM